MRRLAAALLLLTASAQAHQHYSVGGVDVSGSMSGNLNKPLQLYGWQGPSMVYNLNFNPLYGAYELDDDSTDGFSFIALSAGDALTEQPFHATRGSHLVMQISAVSGPAGGHLGFWERETFGDPTDEEGQPRILTHSTPTISLSANQSTGNFRFDLSIIDAYPGSDPYGHIHNRAWTVDIPGDYFISFNIYDIGGQGPGGGALEAPSSTYVFHFKAVPEPATALFLGAGLITLGVRRPRRMR